MSLLVKLWTGATESDGRRVAMPLIYELVRPPVCGVGVGGRGGDARADGANGFAESLQAATDIWATPKDKGGNQGAIHAGNMASLSARASAEDVGHEAR